MSYLAKAHRSGLRRAIIASAIIHFWIAVIAVLCALQFSSSSRNGLHDIDTSIQDVKINFDGEESTSISPPEQNRSENPSTPSPQETPSTAQLPTLTNVPGLLPPEFLAIIQRSQLSQPAAEI